MNWEQAKDLISKSIMKGMDLNTKNSSFRIVLETPPYICTTHNYIGEGFKVQIGKNSSIEIPISMIKMIFDQAQKNQYVYDTKLFSKIFPKQQIEHGCHVHVLGQLFVKSSIARQINIRTYKLF